MYKDKLSDEGVTLKDLIIFACIDEDGIKKVVENMDIEFDYDQIQQLVDDVYTQLMAEVSE